ncbi:proteasome subunit alpha type-2, putative [Entamoeba invadens IP1]|uniref:Proteasome subunit alpha type n=1 Tax=Entamoeba invadens TaxID=33085 RepID=S0B4Y8_ENTIV|nr:proteasome subunit alpha type-2, putative [Entamoeba invadens IP1]ELP93145.1 proteasome subunit alpha type-2, putative [Entamoeba invadens IP1]BAN42294.1 proteasome subunit alpha type-2, putative [Entamoeba invadens]|eukprot:XP_004259916.1 proteasome subunit alpha type-2, putative [Entamoeba invadens IP1]
MEEGEGDYGFSLTTFSPSGKLVQIEYALNAMTGGSTSVGIKATDGIVLVVEKILPPMYVSESIQKINNLNQTVGMVSSGMGPDARVLVKKGRKAGQKYWLEYQENIDCSMMTRNIAYLMQEYTQKGGVRPFGVSVLIAGFDKDTPRLYQVDPSGAFWTWKATALGKNMTTVKTFLEKRYHEDIQLEDAIHTAILALKEGFEGEMNEHNIEIGICTKKDGFKVFTPEEIKDYLDVVK